MTTGATKWAWENSRASNGSLIVLLAIADECGEGEFTEMSVADLMRKCRLSDKGVRRAVKDLEALGELSVESRPGGTSRYAPCPTPVKMTGLPRSKRPDYPGQNDRPVKTSPRSKRPDPPEESQVSGTPVKMTGPEISDMFVSSTGRSVVTVKDVPAKPPRRRDDRPDVDRLCTHLAARIVANGNRAPAVTGKWRDAARLLLDKDGITEEQAHAAIDWSQDSEFWRANILSMPKLREKYDTLRQQARRTPRQASGNENLAYVADFLKRHGESL